MESKLIIKKFLDNSELEFIENEDHFFIDSLKIKIPFNKEFELSQMQWSTLAMEIGTIKIRKLIIELELSGEPEGAKIYDFSKKINS